MRALGAMLTLLYLATGCQAELASDLPPQQADEALLALDETGITGTKRAVAGGRSYRLEVDRSQLIPAVALLRERGLLEPRAGGLEGLQTGGGLIPSAAQQRARVTAAQAVELSRTLERLAWVEEARVHLGVPDAASRPLDAPPVSSRASVLLTTAPGAPVDEEAARAIVVGGIAGLSPEAVRVVISDRTSAAPVERRIVRVGPIDVAAHSASTAKALAGGSLALNLLLAGALIVSRRLNITRSFEPRRAHASARTETEG